MSKIIKGVCAVLACGFIAACGNSAFTTRFEFSFGDSGGNYFSDEKSIYINESKEELVLNASLIIDGGKAAVDILDADTNELVTGFFYESSADFDIVLMNVQEGQEYIISVKAEQTKKIDLVVSSSEKLVKNKEKPGK